MFLAGTRSKSMIHDVAARRCALCRHRAGKACPRTSRSSGMLVRAKKEIITMKMPLIRIRVGAPSVRPVDLKRWLDQGTTTRAAPW
jgi:hypothetical protein